MKEALPLFAIVLSVLGEIILFHHRRLRNLSQHDEETTMAIPKYQLAEYRYGREEMLALFDRSVLAPEPLRSVNGLYVEKLQLPLALIQMSEEETVRSIQPIFPLSREKSARKVDKVCCMHLPCFDVNSVEIDPDL